MEFTDIEKIFINFIKNYNYDLKEEIVKDNEILDSDDYLL